MTRYELKRFVKALPVNIILILIFTPLFMIATNTSQLLQRISQLFQELIAGQYFPLHVRYYSTQLELAYKVLGAFPDPLRGYVAFLLLLKGDIVSISFSFQFILTVLMSVVVIFALTRTSRIKSEEVYLFVRADRGKLLVFRSIVSALLYSLLATLLVYILRLYIYNSALLTPFSSLIDWLTPLHVIILPLFFFLLFAQAIIALINIYFPRMTLFVPFFLLFSCTFILQYTIGPSPLESIGASAISLVTLLLGSPGMPTTYIQQILLNQLIFILHIRGGMLTIYFLPFGHLLTLIHFFSGLASGVWNITSFDPSRILMEAFISFPVSLLVQGGELLPQAFIVFTLLKFLQGLPYNPLLSFAYLVCPAAALLYLAAKLFNRKTI